MDFFEFDFRFHTDLSTLAKGPGHQHHTQYFELVPGPYKRKHWQPGSRFIDEYTFSLIEGPFEEHAPAYDHFSHAEVSGSEWILILGDLAALRAALIEAGEISRVTLPYGGSLTVQPAFEQNWAANQPKLASLLFSLDEWIIETLARYGSVSVLGL
jgi:hypothetical protein